MKCEFYFDFTSMNVMMLNVVVNELNAMNLSHDIGFTKREFELAKKKAYDKIRNVDHYMIQNVSLDWFLDHGYIHQIGVDQIKISGENAVVKMPDGTSERVNVNWRGECSVTFEMPKTGSVIIERETIDAKRYVYAINGEKFEADRRDAVVDFRKTIDKMNATVFAAQNLMRL